MGDEMGKRYSTPIRSISIKKAVTKLQRQIRCFETRYECSSEDMQQRIDSGNMPETAEVLSWAQKCHHLRFLREAISPRA